jgi:hypothetical protein
MLLGNMVGFDIFPNRLGGLLRRWRRQGVRMKFKLYRAEDCLAGCIDNAGWQIEEGTPNFERRTPWNELHSDCQNQG